MERAEILERVCEVVSDVFGVAVAQVSPDTSFSVEFNAETLQKVELVEALDDIFDVELDEEELLEAETPAELVDLIEDALDESSRR